MDNENYQKVKDYAIKLISFRPRSAKELLSKLSKYSLKKGFGDEIPHNILKDLESKGYINDLDFAKWWISQRRQFRPKGEYLLKLELREKGIGKEIIDKIFSETGIVDDLDSALKIAGKKLVMWAKLPYQNARIKLSNLLLRRGFSWDIIYKVIDYTLKKS